MNTPASDKTALTKLAASLPVGDQDRRAILSALAKAGGGFADVLVQNVKAGSTFKDDGTKRLRTYGGPNAWQPVEEFIAPGSTIKVTQILETFKKGPRVGLPSRIMLDVILVQTQGTPTREMLKDPEYVATMEKSGPLKGHVIMKGPTKSHYNLVINLDEKWVGVLSKMAPSW